MNRTISLYALVISYKKVPVEIRKLFSFSKDEIGIFLAKLKEIQGVEGAVVLSTCNRTEVYFSYDDSRRHISEIICDVEVLFSSFKDLAVTALRKWVLSYMGIGAVKHLFHVTSGLDSAVLGENEIVAQVKEAYGITVENEFADFVINTVFQKGLAVFFVIMSMLYAVSPIDLAPDAIPVIGWLDDIGFLATAGMNAVQQFTKDQNSSMVKILKYTKWLLILATVIAALLLGGLI